MLLTHNPHYALQTAFLLRWLFSPSLADVSAPHSSSPIPITALDRFTYDSSITFANPLAGGLSTLKNVCSFLGDGRGNPSSCSDPPPAYQRSPFDQSFSFGTRRRPLNYSLQKSHFYGSGLISFTFPPPLRFLGVSFVPHLADRNEYQAETSFSSHPTTR